jgi:hypothetical protein
MILDMIIVVMCSAALVIHLLRLIYLLFEPGFLKKYPTISNRVPSKSMLALYYLLAIVALLMAITAKLGITF